MKRFFILFRDCGYENIEFLQNASEDIEVSWRSGDNYLCDHATGCRILSPVDELLFYASSDQLLILKLRFEGKIQELA